MSAPAPIVLSGPADLIAAMPHLLGFQPSESVVVMTLRGSVPVMTVRLDIPAPGEVEAMVGWVLPPVLRDRPDAVVIVGYAPEFQLVEEAMVALEGAVVAAGVRVHDCVMVSPVAWRHLGASCPCCTVEGHPVPPSHHRVAVEVMVRTGSDPAVDRAAYGARLAVGERTGAVGRACDRLGGSVSVESGAQAWGTLLDSETPVQELTDEVLAGVALAVWGRERVQFRDAVLSLLCGSTEWVDVMDPEVLGLVERHLVLSEGPDRMEHALGRLVHACAATPDRYAVPLLGIVAMCAWWDGKGVLARFAVDRALAAEPGHQLALLVQRALDFAVPPPTR